MLHEKHIKTATALLGEGSPEYTAFMATLSEDITNLKAMLKAISIGDRDWAPLRACIADTARGAPYNGSQHHMRHVCFAL